MPYLCVRKMKTAASWKKNDPILETRQIALQNGKTRRKIIFIALDPPLALSRETSQKGQKIIQDSSGFGSWYSIILKILTSFAEKNPTPKNCLFLVF